MTADEESLLADLLDQESGLTGWEMDFLDNIDQNYRERALTEKQRECLNRIARKLTLTE